MYENSDYERPIHSKRLKEALGEASDVLGRAAKDAMFHDLELNGITLMGRPYTLRDARGAKSGRDGTTLQMHRVEKTLQEHRDSASKPKGTLCKLAEQ